MSLRILIMCKWTVAQGLFDAVLCSNYQNMNETAVFLSSKQVAFRWVPLDISGCLDGSCKSLTVNHSLQICTSSKIKSVLLFLIHKSNYCFDNISLMRCYVAGFNKRMLSMAWMGNKIANEAHQKAREKWGKRGEKHYHIYLYVQNNARCRWQRQQ